MCGILFLATVLSYLDRQTMAICQPWLEEEFHLTHEQYGELLSAFRWTYAVMQLPAGWLADRFSVRIIYGLAVSVWSLAGALAAWVSSVRVFAWTRAALGAGEAFNTPCALRTTADILRPEDRGLGNGIFMSGSALGALFAPLFIGPIAEYWGWREAFFAIGSLGGMWVVLWLWSTRDWKPAGANEVDMRSNVPEQNLASRLLTVLKRPGFWLMALVSITINPTWYFCAEWIPAFMHDQQGFGKLAAGFTTIPVFLGADIGNLAGGGLVKLLVSKGWTVRGARAVTCTVSAAMVLPVSVVGYVDNVILCIALLGVATCGLMGLMANYLVCLQEVSLANVGLIAGILGALANVVGAVVNPYIGRYVDQTGTYHLIFVLVAMLPLVSLGAILLADTLRRPSA